MTLRKRPDNFLTRRRRLLFFIGFLLLASLISTKLRRRIPHDVEPATGPLSVKPIDVTAERLARAFLDTPNEASRDYRKKTVRVTGTVYKSGEVLGKAYVKLFTGEETSNFQYFANSDNREDILSARPGEVVTVTGVCKGLFSNVVVVE